MTSAAIPIPNEILALIFDSLGSKWSHDRPPRDWLACSLVCWKWRCVVLPYLFYRAECSMYTAGRTVSAYSRFFAENPKIGANVRLLVLRDIPALDIALLGAIIGNLPRLLHLRMSGFTLVNDSGNPLRRFQDAHVLKSLTCGFLDFLSTDEGRLSFFHVFALFSRIEYLELSGDSTDDSLGVPSSCFPRLMEEAVRSNSIGKLQINRIRLGPATDITYFYPTLLTQIKATQHLTSLTFHTRYELLAMEQLNECLCSTGTTLKLLHIIAEENRPFHTHASVRSSDTFTDVIRKGFEACVSLEEFRLTVEVSGVGHSRAALWERDVKEWIARTNPPDDSPYRAWQRIVLIFGLLPPLGIHHLHLKLLLDSCNMKDAHSLAWPELKQSLRRYTNLDALEVIVEDWEHTEWHQCVAYEMEEFEHIFRDPLERYR
ncbi:hypothetical protein BC629DRAFT_1597659 [Irpex lacteus]|nr:hypothetical protein BC629DRAFT_1597659 [Irpex lacteus]